MTGFAFNQVMTVKRMKWCQLSALMKTVPVTLLYYLLAMKQALSGIADEAFPTPKSGTVGEF